MNSRFMMQQAQKLQAQLLKAQEELATLTVEGSSGGGAVKVVMNGQQQIQSVKISPEVVNKEDVEMLEDLILAAVKEAQAMAQEAAAKKMGGLTGGLKIPGLT
jgi:DNA-binding YbaB/EbfC family protein